MSTWAVYFLKQVYSDIIKEKPRVLLVVLLNEVCSMCIWDADSIQVELVQYGRTVAVDQLPKLLSTFHQLDSLRLSV